MDKIYNWGLYPQIEAELLETNDYNLIQHKVAHTNAIIPRGNGRCYGDSALQTKILSSLSLNKFLAFDTKNGILQCEAGVLLSEILAVIIPKGFFLPVTPGTKYITIGGAVASNIHGKNHHKEGSISRFIISFDVLTADGTINRCSATSNQALFQQTIGGMGLTGMILTVTFKLKKIETSLIRHTSIKTKNLDELLAYFEEYNRYTYSVAWIDCLAQGTKMGRALLNLGEHVAKDELPNPKVPSPLTVHNSKKLNIPFFLPSFTLNTYSIRVFNFLYYHKQSSQTVDHISHYDPFFYPLDRLSNWNRIYGRKGFTQYQFVIPYENGKQGLKNILSKISQTGLGSFLAVLKTMGSSDSNISALSFPMRGYTLALDFKISPKVFQLLDQLDEIVLDYGGRVYLTKDARLKQETFVKMYPDFKQETSPFRSMQLERLTSNK